MTSDFRRLPPATALLLLASLCNVQRTKAHALPTETITLDHRPLNVIAWPPLPTSPPYAPAELIDLRRRQDSNTICGFIGGDPDLPATCSAGSHCVLDEEHGAVGCCPNGQDTCTTGVFTGCVDVNSDPQTEVDPYIFTCQGANVCYKNIFENGFYQYGCGTASSLATTVEAFATGITSRLSITGASVPLTASATSLSEPTTIDATARTRTTSGSTTQTNSASSSSGSTSSSGSSSSASSSASTSSSVSSTRTSTASPSTTSHSTASSSSTVSSATVTASRTTQVAANSTDPAVLQSSASPTNVPPVNRTGAIIGGVISGIAVLIAGIAMGFLCWRRRRSNTRRGPGPRGQTQYISPMSGGPHNFQQLHNSQEGYESGLAPGMMGGMAEADHGQSGYGYGSNQQYGPSHAYHDYSHNMSQPGSYQQPDGYGYPYPGVHPALRDDHGDLGAAGAAGAAEDRVPLTQEIDDFSQGYQRALSRIGEEDEYQSGSSGRSVPFEGVNEGNVAQRSRDLADSAVAEGDGDDGEGRPRTGSRDGPRPLWQQNRQLSRNLMWM